MSITNVPDLRERPHFGPRQIRTIEGLNVGDNVIQFCEGYGAWALFKIITFGVSQAGWFITVKEIGRDGYYKCERVTSLYDCNIKPKDTNLVRWNALFCLLRTKAKTAKELCRTKQKFLIRKN